MLRTYDHALIALYLKGIDILEPLSKLQWETFGGAKSFKGMVDECLLLNNRIYVRSAAYQENDVLYCASIDNMTSWTPLSGPAINRYSLTSYHSRLVLLGGVTYVEEKVLNDLWVMSDDEKDWQQTLPPMLFSRCGAAVVNSGKPEYLIVFGGCGSDKRETDTIEVLINMQWSLLKPLPAPYSFMKPVLCNRDLHNDSSMIKGKGIYCSFKTLQAACSNLHETGALDEIVWTKVDASFLSIHPLHSEGN